MDSKGWSSGVWHSSVLVLESEWAVRWGLSSSGHRKHHPDLPAALAHVQLCLSTSVPTKLNSTSAHKKNVLWDGSKKDHLWESAGKTPAALEAGL